jgi:hypothetical protein
MTSAAKIEANRRNAQRSTGPRSAAGKARARGNAFKHGLCGRLSLDRPSAAEIEQLAKEFWPWKEQPEGKEVACEVAEAALEVERVRRRRIELINSSAPRLDAWKRARPAPARAAIIFAEKAEIVAALDLYEKRALGRRNRALRRLDHLIAIRRKGPVGPRYRRRPRRRDNLFEDEIAELLVSSLIANLLRNASTQGLRDPLVQKFERTVRAISFPSLVATNLRVLGQIVVDRGKRHGELSLSYGDGRLEKFSLIPLPGLRGRDRWFVLCPESGCRVQALYFAPGQTLYRSRHALHLRYRLQTFDKAEAAEARFQRALESIGGEPDMPAFESPSDPSSNSWSIPDRPAYMPRLKYWDACDQITRQHHLALCHLGGYPPRWECEGDWPPQKPGPSPAQAEREHKRMKAELARMQKMWAKAVKMEAESRPADDALANVDGSRSQST